MRAVAIALLIALLTGTFLFGGCVSCPQFFMIGSASAGSGKNCCSGAGHCEKGQRENHEQAGRRNCTKIAVEAQSKIQVDPPLAIDNGIEATVPAEICLIPHFSPEVASPRSGAFQHSPPDLQVLNATFLI